MPEEESQIWRAAFERLPFLRSKSTPEEKTVFDPVSRTQPDLPHDGNPEQSFFHNPKGLAIQTYRWLPTAPPTGVVVLLHGVKAHLRLTWLVKRPLCLEGQSQFRAKQYAASLSPSTCSSSRDNDDSIQSLRAFLADYSQSSSEEVTSSVDTAATPSAPECDDLQGVPEADRRTQLFYKGSWIEAFVESGLAVFGMDLQGHGRSDGWRGKRSTAESFDDWRDDTLLFLDSVVRSEYPGRTQA